MEKFYCLFCAAWKKEEEGPKYGPIAETQEVHDDLVDPYMCPDCAQLMYDAIAESIHYALTSNKEDYEGVVKPPTMYWTFDGADSRIANRSFENVIYIDFKPKISVETQCSHAADFLRMLSPDEPIYCQHAGKNYGVGKATDFFNYLGE